jgi:hypothetical protein
MADVLLTITLPHAWVPKTLDAFLAIADTHITITSRGSAENPEDDFSGSWDLRIDDPGVLNTAAEKKAYGEKVLRELGKAIVNMVDLAEDKDRYQTEINAVTAAASDVPDDVLT